MPPALREVLPPVLGVMLLAAVLFGGTGVEPAALVRQALADGRALVVLTAAWLLLATPAVRALRRAPGLALLRSLPRGRVVDGACTLLGLASLHLPWTALWWHGAGAGAALVAFTGIAALSLGLAALPGWPLPATAPRWPSAGAALRATTRRALLRHGGGALARALALTLAGGALLGAIWRHAGDAPADATRAALVIGALTLGLALAGPCGVIAQALGRAPWLARSLGVSPGAQISCAATTLGGLGALLGAIASLTARGIAPPPDHLAALAPPLLGLTLRAGAAATVLRDGPQRTVTLALLVIGAVIAGATVGAPALLLAPGAALALTTSAATAATRARGAGSR